MRDQVEDGEEEGESELAYLKMPDVKYYSITLVLYVGCVTAAVFFTDIGTIFEYVGAFGLSITSFLLPGAIYLKMLRHPKALLEVESSRARKCNTIGSVAMIAISVFNMVLVVVKTALDDGSDE